MNTQSAQIITLKTRRIGTMNAIYLGPECLVESECKAGTWYVVSDGKCTCPGNTYHGHCKHVAVAETAALIEERESVPVLPEYVDSTALPIETALATLAQAPQPEIAALAAEILEDLEASRPDLSGCEKRAMAKTTAKVRLGLIAK